MLACACIIMLFSQCVPTPAHTSAERYIKGIALKYGHIIAMVALRRRWNTEVFGFGGSDQSE